MVSFLTHFLSRRIPIKPKPAIVDPEPPESRIDAFSDIVAFVIEVEGGLTDDTGGLTKFGISRKAFPNEDIIDLTEDKAKQIYRKYYWDYLELDKLPRLIAQIMFDTAVNIGNHRAVLLLQSSLTAVKSPTRVDGIIGPKTVQAVLKAPEKDLAIELIKSRITYYARLRNNTFNIYKRGWINRVFKLMEFVGLLK